MRLSDFPIVIADGAARCLQVNPLGHEVTLLSAVMLNLGQLLGSGIFSVPGVVLDSVGSVGLLLSFWAIAPIFALGSWFLLQYRSCSFLSNLLSSQSLCSPTRNLLASFPDDPARKLYFSSRPIHAQDSLCLLLSPLLRFSFRSCIFCDYYWGRNNLVRYQIQCHQLSRIRAVYSVPLRSPDYRFESNCARSWGGHIQCSR